MKPIRYGVLILAICFALLLSALNTAPAFADEATPPADETTSSEEVVVETEATTNEEDEATLPDVSEVDTVSDEESTTVAEVIEALPENTQIIVLDENGEALPLASAEAEEAVHNGDPLWCPAGVAPKPNMGGCSPSFTSFNNDGTPTDTGLLAWLLANQSAVAKAGVIWVESSYAPLGGEGGPIIIDGVNFVGVGATMDDFALTINGGWNGTSGSTTLNPNDPSQFDVRFVIQNWTGAITINNIAISGATGSNEYALNVSTSGNITLNNVDIVDNTASFGGAYITNTSGTGNVTVNDSTFNNNTGSLAYGLEIYSKGTVTLKNVTANSNTQIGAFINNSTAITPKVVNLNGTNHFSYNGESGLYIRSKGIITLNNITAMNNGNHGVYLDNCSYFSGNCTYGVSNGVSVKGSNNFSNNGYDGLRVISGGVITVNNITANGNGTNPSRPAVTLTYDAPIDATGKGVFLLNIGATTPKNITISGTNTFNFNASNGLSVFTDGMITVNNITANFNKCSQTKDTDPTWCAGAVLLGTSGVTQTGYGRFEFNNDHADQKGLFVFISSGKGAITLNNLYAVANGSNGVEVEATGGTPATAINVTLNGANTFLNNDDSGLSIEVDGTVTLNNLTAENNGEYGVFVSNIGLTKAVTLKGINTFNLNTYTGLYIESYGAITTNAVSAFGNSAGQGVYLTNCLDNGGTCDALTTQPITMNGNNVFESNGGVLYSGLSINSRGAVTINNLTASYNGFDGATIINNFTNSIGAVTIKGYTTTLNNGGSGLFIVSKGAVSLINVTANLNNSDGAVIRNYGSTTQPVTISGVNNFSQNTSIGIIVQSYGAITTTALTAFGNQGHGVWLDNCVENVGLCTALTAQPVTMNANNFLQSNQGTGLRIDSRGAVTINNLTSSFNSAGDGAMINNGRDNAVGAVAIKGFMTALDNSSNGLQIDSNGNVTLANITASYNGNSGLDIYNANSTAVPVNVTITGTNVFNNNSASGLYIFTYGAVLLNNLTANDNLDVGGAGVFVDNSLGTMAKPVTINGMNMMNGNSGDGLYIVSLGAIKVNNVMANYNLNGYGASLVNGQSSGFSQPVTITGYGIFTGNVYNGLNVDTNGNATFANINANENDGGGAYINALNPITNGVANVSFTGVNTFNYNTDGDGLTVITNGAITISNITANENENYGAYLDNQSNANLGPTGNKTVTVSGVNMFNGNQNDGLSVYASGNVTLTRITANNNNDTIGGAPQYDGVYVYSSLGNISLICGSMYNNEGNGYDLNVVAPGKTITLKGVFTFGNPLGDDAPAAIITRTCPLP